MIRVMHNARTDYKCLLHISPSYVAAMATAGERLRQAREKAGYTSAREAALAMGVPYPTYSQHENGHRGYPASKAERYGRFYRVAPEWLLYGRQSDDATPVALGPRLFIKGEVAAGVWKEAWEFEPDEWEVFTGRADVSAPLQKRFGLRVAGESMNEVYPIGSVLECVQYDQGESIPNGRRVIVQRERIDGTLETTVKEMIRTDDGTVWLRPRSTNPSFLPFRGDVPDDPDITRVEIIGVVVGSYRPE